MTYIYLPRFSLHFVGQQSIDDRQVWLTLGTWRPFQKLGWLTLRKKKNHLFWEALECILVSLTRQDAVFWLPYLFKKAVLEGYRSFTTKDVLR